MKVLQVFEPGCDGVFRHVEKLCEFLHQRGVESDLLYSSRRGSRGLQKLVEEHRSRGATAIDLNVGPAPCAADLGAIIQIIKACRQKRYDVVHAHSSKAGALVRLAAPFLEGTSVLYTPHAYFGMSEAASLRASFYNYVEMSLSGVGRTINISADEAAFSIEALRRDPAGVVIIPNPVDSERFQPASADETSAARARFGIAADARVIAFAGRFSFQKDPMVAFRAFADCAKKNPRAHFLYLCKQTQRTEAESFFSNHGLLSRVTFVDYMEDVRPFYHCADVFLLTSRYEAGWPFAILEAMACNLPIVTAVCPGMSDIATSGLNQCWTFEVGSDAGCLEALRSALKGAGTLVPNHREIVGQRFSVEGCFGKIEELYQRARNREAAVVRELSAIPL